MKKLTLVLATTALLLMGTTTAFAHCGGGGHHRRNTISYSTCNYADCNLDYNHTHDGCYYYGHYYGDGHDYHDTNCGNGYCY